MCAWYRRLLFYPKSQQVAILTLLLCLLLLFAMGLLFNPKGVASPSTIDSLMVARMAQFEESLIGYKSEPYAEAGFSQRYYPHRIDTPLKLHAFDPNAVDSLTLLGLGFPPWMAHNLLQYRKKGGYFRQPSDIEKLYGMTSKRYQELLPFVTIAPKEELPVELQKYGLPNDFSLEINSADTAMLRLLPGIGVGYSERIVRYRQRLGGFVLLEQLLEIEGIDSLLFQRIEPYLTLSKDSVKLIRVNRASVERLKGHPYINFYQAKALYETRRALRYMDSAEQLYGVEGVDSLWIKRITPYLDFTIPDSPRK